MFKFDNENTWKSRFCSVLFIVTFQQISHLLVHLLSSLSMLLFNRILKKSSCFFTFWGNVKLLHESTDNNFYLGKCHFTRRNVRRQNLSWFCSFWLFPKFLKLVICESSCPQNTKYKISHPKKPRNN